MCGILGIFSSKPRADIEQRVQEGIKLLHHRGPDDQGCEIFPAANGMIALGHTRLSIIDLSTGGHQPMSSSDGRYVIVFNGEIYNYIELRRELLILGYVFRTDSDTEVLLASWAQWGADCLPKLRGMFAFAIFDSMTASLTCVRDAFGIKPLFYHLNQNGFIFASELSALLCLLSTHPGLNLQRAYDYLVFGGHDHNEATFFKDILHVLPGHIIHLDLRENALSPQSKCWWWPSIKERTDLSFTQAGEQLREMFLRNIRLHLRSDAPFGAALSGGVDSSAVVCAMRYLEPDMPIHTFSFVARGSDVDEEYWVDIVNRHVGAIAHKIVVNPQELGRDLDDMIKAQGEPFGSTSIYAQYRMFQLAREQGITVTLDGQGADELLAGYNGYPHGYLHSLLDQHRYMAMPNFLNAWLQWPGRSRNEALKSLGVALIPTHCKQIIYQFAGRKIVPEWMNYDWMKKNQIAFKPPENIRVGNDDGRGRRLTELLRSDITGRRVNRLLRYADRNSMHWSIENRVPFLTTDLAEFLLSLPENFLLSQQGQTKFIFRSAMRGIVPDLVLDRRDKIGFDTPERAWLQSQSEQISQWLEAADELPFLDAFAIRQKVKDIIEGNQNFSQQAWRFINYCRWVQLQ